MPNLAAQFSYTQRLEQDLAEAKAQLKEEREEWKQERADLMERLFARHGAVKPSEDQTTVQRGRVDGNDPLSEAMQETLAEEVRALSFDPEADEDDLRLARVRPDLVSVFP